MSSETPKTDALWDGSESGEKFDRSVRAFCRSLERENNRLFQILDKAIDGGHSKDCRAWCGPDGEEWTEDAHCNCFYKDAVKAKFEAKGED